jgi:hypothetical protein
MWSIVVSKGAVIYFAPSLYSTLRYNRLSRGDPRLIITTEKMTGVAEVRISEEIP